MGTMPASMPSPRYTPVAVVLHWLVAAMILLSLCVGATMVELPLSPTRLKLYNWHKWAGIVILSLSLLRLGWRLRHAPPASLPMPAWQARAAHAVHGLLLALCIAVPLLGWAYSSAAGFPVVVFGVLPLPDWVSPDRALAETLKAWHGNLAGLLALLVALHVAAALKHHLVDHDGLLQRMTLRWPTRPPKGPP